MLDATDTEEALFWLGRTRLREENHRAGIPQSAFELDLLEPESRLFWAADPEIPAAFLTNHDDLFEDDDEVLLAGSGDVDRDRVATLPSLLYEGNDGDSVPVFERNATVHYLTNPELMHADVCMAAPKRIARRLFDTRLDEGV